MKVLFVITSKKRFKLRTVSHRVTGTKDSAVNRPSEKQKSLTDFLPQMGFEGTEDPMTIKGLVAHCIWGKSVTYIITCSNLEWSNFCWQDWVIPVSTQESLKKESANLNI